MAGKNYLENFLGLSRLIRISSRKPRFCQENLLILMKLKMNYQKVSQRLDSNLRSLVLRKRKLTKRADGSMEESFEIISDPKQIEFYINKEREKQRSELTHHGS
jgi:hypothetical protein